MKPLFVDSGKQFPGDPGSPNTPGKPVNPGKPIKGIDKKDCMKGMFVCKNGMLFWGAIIM